MILGLNFDQPAYAQMPGNFGQAYLDSLIKPTPTCGDLNSFRDACQLEYRNFSNNLPSRFSDGDTWDLAGVYQCGNFTIYYHDFISVDGTPSGGGFADPILGEGRRNTLCEVLNYIDDVLDVHPTAFPVVEVLDSYYSGGNPAPAFTQFLAQAGSYYDLNFGLVSGIYNGHFANYIQTGLDPDLNFDYDAALRVNFHETNAYTTYPVEYFNFQDPLENVNRYDLFSVLLHEVTHMLGFNSAMGEDPVTLEVACENTGNSYTRFDWEYGYYENILNLNEFNNHKLLIGSATTPQVNPNVNTIEQPLRRANIWINNEGPPNNHNMFAGLPSGYLTPSFEEDVAISFLSHLGLMYFSFPYRQQFSPGRYQTYVMEPTLYYQELERSWSKAEIEIMTGLGYNLNPAFLLATTLSPPNINSDILSNSAPIRTDYNLMGSMLVPLTEINGSFSNLDDYAENKPAQFSIVNSNTAALSGISTVTMNLGDDVLISDLDNDVIRTKPELIFGIRGVSDGEGNNHNRLSLDATGRIFVYTPPAGYHGRAEFGFYLWDGKEIGGLKVYTIDVLRDESLVYPPNEELVLNGNFEDGFEVKTWEEPTKVYTSNYFVNAQPQLHFGLLGAGGGHKFSLKNQVLIKQSLDNWPEYQIWGADNAFGMFGHWWSAAPSGFVIPTPNPNSQTLNNSRYARFGDLISSLKRPLVEEEFYEIRFRYAASATTSSSNSDYPGFALGDQVNVAFEIIDEPVSASTYNIIQTIDYQITINELTAWNEPSTWNEGVINFQYCGEVPALHIRSIPLDYGILYVDDISLKINPSPPPISVNAGSDIYLSPACPNEELAAIVFNTRCDMTYSWTPSIGLSDPTILNPLASPTVTTTYTITVTDPLTSQTASDQVTVYVIPDVVNYGSISLCPGDPAVNLFNNVNLPGGSFQIFGSTSATLTDGIFDTNTFGAGSYTAFYSIGESPCEALTFFSIFVQGYTALTASHPNGLIVTDNGPNDGQTLGGNRQFLQDLVIQSGAVYTISAGTIQFAEGKGIRIMPGGRLVVQNNSVLREIDCGTHWNGIRVQGIPNISQHVSQANLQGNLTMRNSEIRNAKIGVANYYTISPNSTGGIIYCQDSKFVDCELSANILDYNNLYQNVSYPVRCSFYNSTFDWTSNFQFINSVNNPMINLRNVKQIILSGCTFRNAHPGLFTTPNNSQGKAAIFTLKASFNVSKGCNGSPPYALNPDGSCQSGDVPSRIEGFQYGVVSRSADGSAVTETSFKCYRGLWDMTSKVYRLTQNSFTSLPPSLPFNNPGPSPFNPFWPIPYGAYLEYSTNYWVEANSFTYPTISGEAGLIVRGSGNNYHQIYDNNFTSTHYGVISYDDNRGLNQNSGLKIECNTFSQNNRGIIVFPTTTAPPSGWGISHTQGSPAQLFNPPFPAGNYFTTTTTSVQNNLDFITYYRHQSEMVPPVIGGVNLITLNVENECPSSFGGGLFEKGFMASNHKNTADSIGNVLSVMIDDGNTEALTDEVIYADYAEAVELYYDLMQVSPNLSEEVMIEAIKKEYELPASLLTLILSSNPHAAKSEKLQRELDERVQPLATYQRDLINQGLDLVSYKEGLEARESYHRTKYSALIDQLVIEAFEDTTGIDQIGEIEAIITGYETPEYAYLLTDLYLKAGNIPAAQYQLDQIAENFELDTRKDAEYLDYQAVYGVLIELANSGDTVLTPTQEDLLEEIAYKPSTRAAGLAAITLSQYSDFLLLETLVEPVDAAPKSNRSSTTKPESQLCKVYPNPSSGIFIVEIPAEFKDVQVRIVDSVGRLVYDAISLDGIHTINIKGASSGNYVVHILSKDEKLVESHGIQIAK